MPISVRCSDSAGRQFRYADLCFRPSPTMCRILGVRGGEETTGQRGTARCLQWDLGNNFHVTEVTVG